jgi:hypothetical protein
MRTLESGLYIQIHRIGYTALQWKPGFFFILEAEARLATWDITRKLNISTFIYILDVR